MKQYHDIKKKAQAATKQKQWHEALQYWHDLCEIQDDRLEGHIGILDTLTKINSIYDAAYYFEAISEQKDLTSHVKSFEQFIRRGQYDSGIKLISQIIELISSTHKHVNFGWNLYFVEALNRAYHTIIKVNKESEDNINRNFLKCARRNDYMEAMVFSPVQISKGRNSLLIDYLKFYNEGEHSLTFKQINNQIIKALVAYQLTKIGEYGKALSIYNAIINGDHCISPEILAEVAYVYISLRKIEQAKKYFIRSLDGLNFDEQEKEVWLDSFLKIANFHEQEDQPMQINWEEQEGKRYTKFFFSGFGWSGSGAFFDFVKEFRSKNRTINWELRMLEHENGIAEICSEILEGNFIPQSKINYLFSKHLMGLSLSDSMSELKFSNSTKRLVLKKNGKYHYAKAVNHFISDLKRFSFTKSNKNEVRQAIGNLLNGIAAHIGVSDEYVALNNMIHAKNVHLIDLIEDAMIIIVKRDPRSQYVARYFEDSKSLFKDADKFIERYKSTHEEFERSLRNLKNQQNVEIVQFEEFVLSEDYRNKLAEKLELDFSLQKKHAYFKPWESIKNVDNYKDFHDQKAIRKIEKELPEFLYEVNT